TTDALALPIKRGKGKAIPAVFASLRSSEFTTRLETARLQSSGQSNLIAIASPLILRGKVKDA
ncbi:MAG: hypothetical protein ACYTX0_53935, partial [Nostoc sp.]